MDNVLREIPSFYRGSLKSVPTVVRTADGRSFLEPKGDSSRVYLLATPSNTSFRGYVVDTHPDFQLGEVVPGLFIGSQDAAANLDLLVSKGITHVVNAAASSVRDHHRTLLSYLSVPLLDLTDSQLSEPMLALVNNFIEEALSSTTPGGRRGAVLVHCNAGVSRSAAVIVAFLMMNRGIRYDDAMALVRAARPIACPNEGFRRQLKDLERRLFGHPVMYHLSS